MLKVLIHVGILEQGHTINIIYSYILLKNSLKPPVREKKPDILCKGVCVLYIITCPQVAHVTECTELGKDVFLYCSPDYLPCDNHIFVFLWKSTEEETILV
jgi:hypothetical protein